MPKSSFTLRILTSLALTLWLFAPMAEAQQISRTDLEKTLRSALARMDQSADAARAAQDNAKKAEDARAQALKDLARSKASERQLQGELANVEVQSEAMRAWGVGEQRRADDAEGEAARQKKKAEDLAAKLKEAEETIAWWRRLGSILVAICMAFLAMTQLVQRMVPGWWRLALPPVAGIAGFCIGNFLL